MARRSAQQRIAALSAGQVLPKQTGSDELLLERLLGGPPLPSQREFVYSHERRVWFTGPIGSAKTTALVAAVIMPALLYPGSRWFVARKHYWTLEETTLKKFKAALARLGPGAILEEQTGPPYRIWLAPAVKGAAPSEIVFYSLDNVDKIKSMEFTGIAIDEAHEVDENMATELDGRLRHALPSQEGTADRGPFFFRFTSNPPSRSHWLHKKFCQEEDCDPIPWGKKIQSKPKENAANLPAGYYETVAQGMTPQQKTRLIDGECGPDMQGKPVFPEFNPTFHVGQIAVIKNLPIIRGWDFGRRRPACVWAQLTPEGWLNRLACVLGDNISLQAFIVRVKNRSAMQFPTHTPESYVDFVDPHGTQKRDVTEETSISVMQKAGLKPRWKDTEISTGLELMGNGLNTLIKGRPRSMFDRVNCNLLIEGYSGGYVYPERSNAANANKPKADGIYEHVMDADRYIEIGVDGGLLLRNKQKLKTNASKKLVTGRDAVDAFFKLP